MSPRYLLTYGQPASLSEYRAAKAVSAQYKINLKKFLSPLLRNTEFRQDLLIKTFPQGASWTRFGHLFKILPGEIG